MKHPLGSVSFVYAPTADPEAAQAQPAADAQRQRRAEDRPQVPGAAAAAAARYLFGGVPRPEGAWKEIRSARFTVDATGANRQRLDFTGGKLGPWFDLRNCGSFVGDVAAGTLFERAHGWKPYVDLDSLPEH